MRIKTRRVGLVAAATLLVALSVLFPAQIAVEPQPVGQPVYRVSIGNPALAHDADSTCDGVDDHIQLQALLDLLPAAVGGRIEIEAGFYSWGIGETVTRNISNVTIIGVGGLVSLDGDDTTALFEAGGDNWLFENIVTDAGGIDTGATSGYVIRNVLIDTTYYAYVTDNIDIEDHSARHESGGDDAIKLDDLAPPDDNSDLDATTTYHGLLPKLAGNASVFLSGNGSWIVPAGSGEGDMLKSTYDTDEDDLIDTAAGGTEWDSSAATGVAYVTTGTWSNRPTGIEDTNILIVSGSVASTEHCRFTADGIEGLSSAELLAAISGEAGASFDWNGQDLTNVGDVDGRDVSADGTKLDGIEAGADVTDAANVAAAGALMDSDTDNVDDLHINWGSGANQVDADDVPESASRFWAAESGADVTSAANVDSAGAVMETDFGATTFLYATLDDTPEAKTPAEVLAILSGEATGSFDWNGQDLTNVGDVDGRDVSADGTKLDGIEAGADVTDAANVNTAGAVMETDYDVQTILHATLDDTPVALTVGEQEVVGRVTGGNIDGLAIGITDDDIVQIDSASVADDDYARFTANGLEGRDYSEVRDDLDVPDITTASVTLYVDAGSGSDSNDGSSGSPKETINGALDALSSVIAHTCTIKVRGQQDYAENNEALEFSRFSTLASITIEAVNSNDEDMYDTGDATGGGNDYLDDSGESWSTDQFNDAYIWIYEGTGAGQIRTISDTTSTRITVSSAWDTNPDNTSYYVVGGGATMTGTGTYHVNVIGKNVAIYGFAHTGHGGYAMRWADFASGGGLYNYASVNGGLATSGWSTPVIYGNFFSGAYVYGIVVGATADGAARANAVLDKTGAGILVYRHSISAMGGAGVKNVLKDCSAYGIKVTEGAGCLAATTQTFDNCGTDTYADGNSWLT